MTSNITISHPDRQPTHSDMLPFAYHELSSSGPPNPPPISASLVEWANTSLRFELVGFTWVFIVNNTRNVGCGGAGPAGASIWACEADTNTFVTYSPLLISGLGQYKLLRSIRAYGDVTFGSLGVPVSVFFAAGTSLRMDNSRRLQHDGTVCAIRGGGEIALQFQFNTSDLVAQGNDTYQYQFTLTKIRQNLDADPQRCPTQALDLGSLVTNSASAIGPSICPSTNSTTIDAARSTILVQCTNTTEPLAPALPSAPPAIFSPSLLAPPAEGIAVLPSSSPTGAIVGGVIGTLAAIAMIVALVLFVLRRRSKPKSSPLNSSSATQELADLGPTLLPAPVSASAAPKKEPVVPLPALDPSIASIPLADIILMQELGKGSWGTVSLAVYRGEFIAVKRLTTTDAAASIRVQTLNQEAKVMSMIKSHRNIVKFIGVCSDASSLGIMMEFCPRGSLSAFLRRNTAPLSPYELFKFAYGVLEGMIVLHHGGLLHRDLAARNVLLDERMFAKVSDFGSSATGGGHDVQQADKLGPFKWQAPEVLRSREYSQQSDVWSFGCTLLELVTKREPYHGYKGNILDLVESVKSGEINPLSHAEAMGDGALKTCQEWVLGVLRSCFVAEPAKRPTFREVRFQINPKAREMLNQYEEELDEADSVLSADLVSHYGVVPSGAPRGAAPKKSSWIASSSSTSTYAVPATPGTSTEESAELPLKLERLGLLGQGSFGSVYLGSYGGQYVAVKVLTIAEESAENIRREASVMAAISQHRNIVQLYGIMKESGSLSIVMELAPKGSLEDYVRAAATIGEAMYFKWTLGIARGMAHLTSSKVIHRDLSARNILLDSALEPKIADFGLGRSVLDPNQETSTQTDVGPLRWFAPECFDLKYSEKTDVWAFGCTLIELITRAVPFAQLSVFEVAKAVRDENRNALETLEGLKVPRWLLDTLSKCFSHESKDRATFAELVAFLEQQASTIDEIRDAEAAIQRRRNKRAGTVLMQ